MAKPKHPMQPISYDEHGVVRFHTNKIVRNLVDRMAMRGYSLNEISRDMLNGMYSKDDYDQLMQQIGYSVCGYCALSLIPEKHRDIAWDAAEALPKPRKKKKAAPPVEPMAVHTEPRPAATTPHMTKIERQGDTITLVDYAVYSDVNSVVRQLAGDPGPFKFLVRNTSGTVIDYLKNKFPTSRVFSEDL